MHNTINTLEEQKPKSIKTVGLLVALFSGLIVFTNGMGAVAWKVIGMDDDFGVPDTESTNPLSFLIEHYVEMCLIMVCFGIIYMVGGIFIRKYRLWANRLISILSALFILIIFGLMITISISAGQDEGMGLFSVGAILVGIFWSTPLGFLIWFLNKQKIKKHFT